MNIRKAIALIIGSTSISVAAYADEESGVINLMHSVDNGMCAIAGFNDLTQHCNEDYFDGWYGDSTDVFRNGRKKRADKGCEPDSYGDLIYPAEDSSCNITNSKAEWRHDTLRAPLESAYREYAKEHYASGDHYFCSFVDKVEKMNLDGKIDLDGYEQLTYQADAMGISCEEES